MSRNPVRPFTRRELLKTISASILGSLFSNRLVALPGVAISPSPFSRFVDVAKKAGLTEPTVCGELNSFTYIIESMATGCAFFDYDNDGWMDIFILSSRRLENTPGSSESPLQEQPGRHFHGCHREGRPCRQWMGAGSALATTTTTDSKIFLSLTTARIVCTAIMAMARSPM